MDTETILNAMVKAIREYEQSGEMYIKRMRQYNAFRERILLTVARLESTNALQYENLKLQADHIRGYQKREAEKDARIAELEKVLDVEYVPKLKVRIAEKDIAIAAYKAIVEKHKEFDAEKDARIAELLDKNMNKESEANKWREGYAQASKMLQDANARIAELEIECQRLLATYENP